MKAFDRFARHPMRSDSSGLWGGSAVDFRKAMSAPSVQTVAILVASYDKSADLWDPLFEMLERNWPGCPFPAYLVCNTAEYSRSGVRTVAVGPDSSWSDTLLAALKRVQEEYVLLWIDDHFVSKSVDSDRVIAAVGSFQAAGGNYLRLQALPKPDAAFNDLFGIVRPRSIYRTSTVASLWRKSILAELLMPGESAWEFETKGSVRSDRYDGFFSVWRDCFQIENLLIKGKIWRRSRHCIEHNLGRTLRIRRPVMTRVEESTLALKVMGNRALLRLPRRLASIIRSVADSGRASC